MWFLRRKDPSELLQFRIIYSTEDSSMLLLELTFLFFFALPLPLLLTVTGNLKFRFRAWFRNGWVFIYKPNGSGFESSCSHLNFRFLSASSKAFLGIKATIECGFTLETRTRMTRTYSQLLNFSLEFST